LIVMKILIKGPGLAFQSRLVYSSRKETVMTGCRTNCRFSLSDLERTIANVKALTKKVPPAHSPPLPSFNTQATISTGRNEGDIQQISVAMHRLVEYTP
jgi:hypothetical protein